MRRQATLIALFALFALLGCGPKYPNCEKDKDCEKGGKGEVCLKGKCVQCKDDNGCPKGQSCSAEGSCEPIAGFCESKTDCPQGEVCEDNRCSPGCEVSSDCPSGQKCQNQECVAADRCESDADCVTGQQCVENRCVTQATDLTPSSCTMETVYFAFNSDEIQGANTSILEKNAECANSSENAGKRIVIKGFTDPRGTEEYNLNLGERRALVVKDYLTRLGVDPSRIRTFSNGAEFAVGTDEDSWAKDRRAEISFE